MFLKFAKMYKTRCFEAYHLNGVDDFLSSNINNVAHRHLANTSQNEIHSDSKIDDETNIWLHSNETTVFKLTGLYIALLLKMSKE